MEIRVSQVILKENHFSLTSAADVIDICKPLFLNSPISYFCWFRMFNNGSSQLLISNPELAKFHLNKKKYLVSPNIEDKLIKKCFYYFNFPNCNDKFEEVLYNYKNLLNIHNPIYLFEKHENYYDSFWFASKKDDPSIYNFYLNNMNVLERFKLYFKDKAEKLILETFKNQLIIPKKMWCNISKKSPITIEKNIIPNLQINKVNFSPILSKKEIEVTQWLARGRTFKEIAKILQISPRTIEHHINNIKRKTGLQRKSQIIDFIMYTGLPSFMSQ
jgi:DNA-binding CsgD family transcriptional regulator